jgi:hypothetical protein
MMFQSAVLAALLVVPGRAAAQHDYRNLDHGRPISTEDAYPVEQGAFEVMIPFNYEREAGESGLMFEPEFMWGLLRNAMVGLGAPIRLGDDGGLAGLRPFAFYNFNTESTSLPAVALRVGVTVPVGALGGERPIGTLGLLLTKSFGTTRVHFNTAMSIGDANGPLIDHPVDISRSVGVDHTLWRHSAVLMADIQRNTEIGEDAWWVAGLGVRMQATPTMVFDIGMQRRLSPVGPDFVLTAGVTRSFALTGGVE